MRMFVSFFALLFLSTNGTALAQDCDPAAFLRNDTSVELVESSLVQLYARLTERNRSSSGNSSIGVTVPIQGVPVSLSGSSTDALSSMLRDQTNYSLNQNQRRFLQIQRLSSASVAAYESCLASAGAFLKVTGDPIEARNFAVTAYSRTPGDGARIEITVINGIPVYPRGDVQRAGNTVMMTIPLPAASSVQLQIQSRDPRLPTLISANLLMAGGQTIAMAPIDVPARVNFRLIEEVIAAAPISVRSTGPGATTRTSCVTSSSTDGILIPESARWLNTSSNRPGSFAAIQPGGTARSVCGRLVANSNADFPTVTSRGTMSAVLVRTVARVD